MKDGSFVAFELVSGTIGDFRCRLANHELLKKQLERDAPESLKNRLKDRHVSVELLPQVTKTKVPEATRQILHVLDEVSEAFTGVIEGTTREVLRPVVDWLHVGRRSTGDQMFGSMFGGAVENPLIHALRNKILKASSGKYSSPHPMELLIYWTDWLSTVWLADCEREGRSAIDSSPFRRIWMYDAQRGAVHGLISRE